jgi:UV DNA damage endonuclease
MIKYGLTCISEILRDQDKTQAYRTMTRKRFKELGYNEGIKQLSERILHNMRFASVVVQHCADNDIAHYRIPQSMPLMTEPTLGLKFTDLPDYDDIMIAIRNIGDTAKRLGVRIGAHPDQFVILASPNQTVCDKSIVDLQMTGWFFDNMGLPQSHESPINIHTSCSIKPGSSLQQIGDRVYHNLMACGEAVYKRFTLENEDKSSFTCETLYKLHCYICDTYNFNLPCVYDNLHDECNPSGDNWLDVFKTTWPVDIVPVMHWSEGGNNGNKRAHVDYITENVGKPTDTSVVWELEVKAKDKAIIKLLKG